MTDFKSGDGVVINYADADRARRATVNRLAGRVGTVHSVDMLGGVCVRLPNDTTAMFLSEDLVSYDSVQKVPTLALIMRQVQPVDEFSRVFAVGTVVRLISISQAGDEAIVQTLDSRPEWGILKSLVVPISHLQFFHRSNSVHAFRSFALGQVLKGLPPLHSSAEGERYHAENDDIELLHFSSDLEDMRYFLSEAILYAGKIADGNDVEDEYRATMREFSNRLYIALSALDFVEDGVKEDLARQDADARMDKYLE